MTMMQDTAPTKAKAPALPSRSSSLETTSKSAASASDAKQQTPARDAVAGACAGAFAKTVVAPIERVKLLMQLQFSIDKKSKTNNGGTSSRIIGDTTYYLSSGRRRVCGAWDVTKQVYREQGILAFWRGEMLGWNSSSKCDLLM